MCVYFSFRRNEISKAWESDRICEDLIIFNVEHK